MTAFLDLFAGIGGFALGAEWAGLRFDHHYYSEIDAYAQRVYSSRFPAAIALGDIRNIRGADLPEAEWIIAGGFPCQDISVAGKGAGLAGERSGLWYEYARLIGELRPRFAIMENVGALAFRGLDSVLGSLAAFGYDAEWQDIRASDVGAPHRRERIWIVAYPSSIEGRERHNTNVFWRREKKAEQVRLGGSDVSDPDDNRHGEQIQPLGELGGSAASYFGSDGKARAMADAAQHGRGQGRTGRPHRGGARETEQPLQTLADTGSGGQQGSGESLDASDPAPNSQGKADQPINVRLRNQWAAEPDVGRVAHGVPARVDRLKCLGNSIVPQIAELIFRQAAFDEWRVT